jgi:hypothetical protein
MDTVFIKDLVLFAEQDVNPSLLLALKPSMSSGLHFRVSRPWESTPRKLSALDVPQTIHF